MAEDHPVDERPRQSQNSIPKSTSQTNVNNSSTKSRANQAKDQQSRRHARRDYPTLSEALPHNNPSRLRNSPQRPQFSLAGSHVYQAHAPSYVAPGYYALNPGYQKPENGPVWGLAKPLPRVVRPGMRRDGRDQDEQGVYEDKDAELEEPGSAEAIPQVGMIEDQRRDAGKEDRANNHGRKSVEDRGYGRQNAGKVSTRTQSERSVVDRLGTPNEEKNNPMDDWLQGRQTHLLNKANRVEDSDLGNRRLSKLSSVEEIPSQTDSVATNPQSLDVAHNQDPNALDLEAGDNADEWSLNEMEAQQYVQEGNDMHNGWASIRAKFREPLAECLATMIAVLIGLSTNLSVITSSNTAGSYQSENWAWGLGVTIGIYLAGGISGAHLNPVISLTLCLYRGFPFRKALIYIAAQLLGGLFAGLIAHGIYRDAIASFDSTGGTIAAEGGSTAAVSLLDGGTSKALFTQPAPFASIATSFFNEFVATAILSCAILALGDDSNAPPGAGMHAFIVGLLVAVLTMAFGYQTGACLNPARDFGPRVVASMVGYGGRVFTEWNAWWAYGAWGATVSGGLVGGLLYDVAIFVGRESPVNYPRVRRRRAKDKARRRWWSLKGRAAKEGRRAVGKDG